MTSLRPSEQDTLTILPPDRIRLSPSWRALIGDCFAEPYFLNLKRNLLFEIRSGVRIYPPAQRWFAAFDHTEPSDVRVVVIGQDPYHGLDQAHGLAFSVLPGTPLPPSLRNIIEETERDLGVKWPSNRGGDLSHWAAQGVLLLNSILTVRDGGPGSHRNIGWERFTDTVIARISQNHQPTVFMLWGSFAQSKRPLIDSGKHLILEAPHPSPLSAHRGWFGSGHFSRANAFLENQGRGSVAWC
ncbi:MAG: uracil-DNA glycosylase [Sphingomonadales bacterium]|nr:uracil-DNA glycosylase [Sphingomonadales bacterium]